jgi:endonuclease/exonuclease/phosphatase family metal-dependent hydrolase
LNRPLAAPLLGLCLITFVGCYAPRTTVRIDSAIDHPVGPPAGNDAHGSIISIASDGASDACDGFTPKSVISTVDAANIATFSLSTVSDNRADRLGVLTFNMWHKDKPAELQAMADRLHSDLSALPDFILLQEVVFGRSRLPGEENTAALLATMLGYHCQATQRTSDREGVAIVSRHPFEYYAERHLESQTSPLLLGFNRVSVMGEFLVPGVGRVRVVNVHFTNWGFEARVRMAQLDETLRWMAEREQRVHADITFLGGDFNAQPQWDEMNLIADAADDPLLQVEDFNEPRLPTKGSPGSPRQRIDYIFISAPGQSVVLLDEQTLWPNGMVVVNEQLESGSHTIYLSDHVALLHEYTIQPAVFAAAPTAP